MEGKLGKGREVTATGISTLLAVAAGTGCASGLLGMGGGFVIVPISYWIILAMYVYQDFTIRTALRANLLVILSPAKIGIWEPNWGKERHKKTSFILKIYGLVRASFGADLVTHQKGERTIRNGEQVILNLTSVPSFTGIMGCAVTYGCLTRLCNQWRQRQSVKWRVRLA